MIPWYWKLMEWLSLMLIVVLLSYNLFLDGIRALIAKLINVAKPS